MTASGNQQQVRQLDVVRHVTSSLTISHRRLSHDESIISNSDNNISNVSETLVFTPPECASALTTA